MQARDDGKESSAGARNQLAVKDLKASRTLVKSAPELWAECSNATSLTRHLGTFGEIRITRLEPETAVAWEGDAASGTVSLEPSGWGTRVVLTATAATEQAAGSRPAEPVADGNLETETAEEEAAVLVSTEEQIADPMSAEAETGGDPIPRRPGALGRLLVRLGLRRQPEPEARAEPAEPAARAEPEVVPPEPLRRRARPARVVPAAENETAAPEPAVKSEAATALDAALDSLGRAHHRPYSRS